MAKIVELTESNFEEVTRSGTVLVDFWAPWCNPCRMLGEILKQAAAESAEDSIIGKVNVDEYPQLAVRFEVNTIPHLILYNDGKVVKEATGVQSKPALVAMLGEK